ncbi:hypothetical protein RFI_26335, partial [Reticulomyxa filosa]
SAGRNVEEHCKHQMDEPSLYNRVDVIAGICNVATFMVDNVDGSIGYVFKCCNIILNPFSGFDSALRQDKAQLKSSSSENARATARTDQEHDENKQEQVHALEQILDMVFVQRMRTERDRQQMSQFLKQSFFDKMEWKTLQRSHQWPDVRITNEYVQIGIHLD